MYHICKATGSTFVTKSIEESAVGPPSPDWESLNFWLVTNVLHRGSQCKQLRYVNRPSGNFFLIGNRLKYFFRTRKLMFSDYYCLDAYITQQPQGQPKNQVIDLGDREYAIMFPFEKILAMQWRHINMLDIYNPGLSFVSSFAISVQKLDDNYTLTFNCHPTWSRHLSSEI